MLANSRRNKNFIKSLVVNNIRYEGEVDLTEAASSCFEEFVNNDRANGDLFEFWWDLRPLTNNDRAIMPIGSSQSLSFAGCDQLLLGL